MTQGSTSEYIFEVTDFPASGDTFPRDYKIRFLSGSVWIPGRHRVWYTTNHADCGMIINPKSVEIMGGGPGDMPGDKPGDKPDDMPGDKAYIVHFFYGGGGIQISEKS